MRYVISYAYEVTHYADFAVEARNMKEALRTAKAALHAGKFSDVAGQPDDTSAGHRVFVLRRCKECDDDLEPMPVK